MAWIYGQQRNVSTQLLRLFFHDFIEEEAFCEMDRNANWDLVNES
ncbi:hypothetical protein RchiOBHm_Chr7g0229481 [Rosa chinensis]|uniref:Uncharacterized protein n=1 Tax=Rosa chinensis TaxID=74649 RepID=A0A2P6PF46_ROSCH|nr:hypothetical protein RchiOBHm_Chr7g0229481 [Rosa chinensis]